MDQDKVHDDSGALPLTRTPQMVHDKPEVEFRTMDALKDYLIQQTPRITSSLKTIAGTTAQRVGTASGTAARYVGQRSVAAVTTGTRVGWNYVAKPLYRCAKTGLKYTTSAVLATTLLISTQQGLGFLIEKALLKLIPTINQDATDVKNMTLGTPANELPSRIAELEHATATTQMQKTYVLAPDLESTLTKLLTETKEVSDDINSKRHKAEELGMFLHEKNLQLITTIGDIATGGVKWPGKMLAKVLDLEKEYEEVCKEIRVDYDRHVLQGNMKFYKLIGAKEKAKETQAIIDLLDKKDKLPTDIAQAREEYQRALDQASKFYEENMKQYRRIIADARTTYRFQRDSADALAPLITTVEKATQRYHQAASQPEKDKVLTEISAELASIEAHNRQKTLEYLANEDSIARSLLADIEKLSGTVADKEQQASHFVELYHALAKRRKDLRTIPAGSPSDIAERLNTIENELLAIDQKIEEGYATMRQDPEIVASVPAHELHRHSKPTELAYWIGQILAGVITAVSGGYIAYQYAKYKAMQAIFSDRVKQVTVDDTKKYKQSKDSDTLGKA